MTRRISEADGWRTCHKVVNGKVCGNKYRRDHRGFGECYACCLRAGENGRRSQAEWRARQKAEKEIRP